jgi:hypothetical protein
LTEIASSMFETAGNLIESPLLAEYDSGAIAKPVIRI